MSSRFESLLTIFAGTRKDGKRKSLPRSRKQQQLACVHWRSKSRQGSSRRKKRSAKRRKPRRNPRRRKLVWQPSVPRLKLLGNANASFSCNSREWVTMTLPHHPTTRVLRRSLPRRRHPRPVRNFPRLSRLPLPRHRRCLSRQSLLQLRHLRLSPVRRLLL